ncbi:Rho- GTP-binding protein RhoN [Linnemannia zychae]|nr:Rho- GTP-binding protein RhoN [Linnemannia zychae]
MLGISLLKPAMARPWSSRTLCSARSTTLSTTTVAPRLVQSLRPCQTQSHFLKSLKQTRGYSSHPKPTESQFSFADGSTSLSATPRYILFRAPTRFQAIAKPILFTAATSFGVFATAAYVWERQQVTLLKRIQAWRSSSRAERPSAREFVQAQSEILQEQWSDLLERYRWIQQIGIPVEIQKTLFMIRSRWMEFSPGERTVWSLIAINSVVFGAWQIPRLAPFMQKWFMHDPSSGRSVTLLTSMFSHQHFWHFGLNMFALHSFAVPLHDHMGMQQFLAFYITTGVTASLASHLFTVARVPWAKMIPSLGASGALFGCISSTAYMYPDASVYIIFLPFLPIKIPVALGAMMGLDLVGILKNWKMFDHYAHLAGSTFGLAYMYAGKDLIWTPLQQKAIELNKDAKLFGKWTPTEVTTTRPRGSSVIEVAADNSHDNEERSAKDLVRARLDKVKSWWDSKGN